MTLTAVPGPTALSRAAYDGWRSADKRVAVIWGALFLDVLAFSAQALVLPIPGPVGQLLTQGALPIALGLALMVNPRAVMRPNAVMLILTVAAVVAIMSSLHSE